MGYTINREFTLGANEGDSRLAQKMYIVVHETANAKATGRNEATYMKREWRNAYTTHIVGDGVVYLIGEPGYVSWGALNANPYAPAQIELQHTLDEELFKKNYRVYIELIRDLCDQFGIPKKLDEGGVGVKGVKSHRWVTYNYGGDHTDPFGYLAKMGISESQFKKDVESGVGGVSPEPTEPAKPKPQSKPKALKGYHDKANRYYTVKSNSIGVFRNKDLSGQYTGANFSKGSRIWISDVHITPGGYTRGKNVCGWVSLNSKYVEDK